MRLNSYPVPPDELKVSVATTYNDENLGGETSGTATAHKGIKPKQINASFLVRYDNEELLGNFFRIAEATDDNGDLVVYDIVERTANAINIRQVQFCGTIDTREMDKLHAWRVVFSLREYLSTAEKTEKRKTATTETESAAPEFENVASYTESQLG